jgi:TldD protein
MKSAIMEAMTYAASLGADYADIRVKDIRAERIKVEDGLVTDISDDRSFGYGVRVFKDGSMGFAAANDLGKLSDAVTRAHTIASASRQLQRSPVRLAAKKPVKGKYQTPVETDPFTVPLADKLGLLTDCDKIMRKRDGVSKTVSVLDFRRDEVTFADTDGSYITQIFCQSGADITAAAINATDTQERNFHNIFRAGYEGIISMKLTKHADRIARESVELLNAPDCPSGEFDLIITPRQLFLQIHESVGHPTELDRVLGSEAAFAGMSFVTTDYLEKGLQYGSVHVNIVADAACPLGLGTFAYDDEGVPGQRYDLIKKGMFTGYQTSRDNATVINQESRGMGLSDGWRNLPIVRMTNINLLPGRFELDDLIKGIENGLLLDENKSWSIDDKRINFQFACEIAHEIKDGRLTGRIYKNPIYSGKSTEFWGSCDGVCNEKYWQLVGVPNCGKGQPMQVMRVSHGSAPARFRNVKVGVSDVN